MEIMSSTCMRDVKRSNELKSLRDARLHDVIRDVIKMEGIQYNQENYDAIRAHKVPKRQVAELKPVSNQAPARITMAPTANPSSLIAPCPLPPIPFDPPSSTAGPPATSARPQYVITPVITSPVFSDFSQPVAARIKSEGIH
ncbi:uncharacterized protein LOC121423499 [Lytechinus variegatus]|uniref:uncharacterized protein LOC121423499 n=1 Tax=Lytechinus variegatus TaxID=7654 RepID=UPI001BB21FDE|nr:uncharacterized protein LOC121423499 [Lytechinus variegatus]